MRAGDLVLYKRRGCDSYELGVVKRTLDDGSAFVWYSGGDTAAHTPADCLLEFQNAAKSVCIAHLQKGEMRRCPACGAEVACE